MRVRPATPADAPALTAVFEAWGHAQPAEVIREGLETWGRLEEVPTLRTDLDNAWAPPYTVPLPGVQYHDDYGWEYVNTAFPESIPKIKQVMALR